MKQYSQFSPNILLVSNLHVSKVTYYQLHCGCDASNYTVASLTGNPEEALTPPNFTAPLSGSIQKPLPLLPAYTNTDRPVFNEQLLTPLGRTGNRQGHPEQPGLKQRSAPESTGEAAYQVRTRIARRVRTSWRRSILTLDIHQASNYLLSSTTKLGPVLDAKMTPTSNAMSLPKSSTSRETSNIHSHSSTSPPRLPSVAGSTDASKMFPHGQPLHPPWCQSSTQKAQPSTSRTLVSSKIKVQNPEIWSETLKICHLEDYN